MAALLYWLTDRYYNYTFGQVKRTARQRTWEFVASLGFGVLGLLAFILDTTGILPISAIGLVFAVSFLEYFFRANMSEWRKIVTRFPENIAAAILVVIISILPFFGMFWWRVIGIKSQIVGVFLVVGVVIILTGVWGHIRLVRTLPAVEEKSDDITV
jgi:predicted benzoate:H+ symporter BenE